MQLHDLVASMKQNINTLSNGSDKNLLFNISTGGTAQENIENFLLNLEKIGNKRREDIEECIADHTRFEN